MAVIKTFKALRPSENFAEKIASVPYDVVNREESKKIIKENHLSFLRVTRAETDFDDNVNPYGKDIYEKAKENLEDLKSKSYLKADELPHFYLYKLEMDGRSQVGITAVFSVDDYDNDVILKHEKTRKEKEDDRTNHIIKTEAQTGPVFLTYRGNENINKIVDKTLQEISPVYNFTATDGIKHSIWILPEEYNEAVTNEIAKSAKLYIADGHHRAASASRARKVKQEKNPNHTGREEYNFFIGVLFPANQLKILPYNRAVFNLNGKNKEDVLDEISEKFLIEKSDQKEPDKKRTFGMYFDGEWYRLTARDSITASLTLSNSVADTLDVSILQDFLLNPILGIDDPRTNKNIDFVGGIRGTKELELLVDSGKAAAAFSLYPVSVDDLIKISDAGEIMPPKSTWFEPKLRDGLLVHLI
jgi:uncharacterized protein (DUF1015 family)